MTMAKTRSTSTSVLIGVGFLLFALGLLAGVHFLSRPSISRRMNDDLNNDLNGRNLRQRGLQYLDPRTVSFKPSSLSDTAPNSGLINDQRQVQQQLPFQQPPEFQPQQPKIRVSYVTSFWAKVRRTEMHPHRKEVEAALLANIHNPHFDQVVIFLDIGSEKGSEVCHHFRRTMKDLSLRLFHSTTEEVNELLYSKLTCVDVYSGQPNYYQMFQNAVSDYVRGDVVVLANADMAFDDTISLARHLNPEVIAALGTRGYSEETPQHLKFIYTQMMDGTAHKSRDADKCAADTRWSWDTWIFHKSKIKGRMRPEDFKRPNQNHVMESFYMNENGAENAALWAVQQSYPFTSLYNACENIYSWSFHLTSKTHQEREIPWMQRGKRSGVVPSPWKRMSRTPECFQANNCFISLPPSST